MAFLHADIAGWTEDNEEEEALSIYSSDNEELGTEEEEPPIKIYYPLFRTATKCDAKTRKTLQKIAQCDENGPYAELRDLAAQMLAELQRVDDIPLVMG